MRTKCIPSTILQTEFHLSPVFEIINCQTVLKDLGLMHLWVDQDGVMCIPLTIDVWLEFSWNIHKMHE